MGLFCRHEWEKLAETTLASAFEQMAASVTKANRIEAGPTYFRKKHIVIATCKKCGRVYKSCESNP